MKYLYLILPAFFLIMLSGCATNESKTVDDKRFKYNIKIDKLNESVSFDSLVDSYRYIKLETSKRCLIGDIAKLSVYGDKIYVLSRGVFCFDLKGRFLFAIDQIGKGPAEFIEATDMSIDDNKIYLYDNSQAKVIAFDAQKGRMLTSYPINYSVKQIQFAGKSIYMNRGSIPNPYIKGSERLIISSIDDQRKIKSFFPYHDYDISTENQFYAYNKNAYWIDPLFNKVYKTAGEKVDGYLHFDFGERNVTESDLLNLNGLQKLRDKRRAFFLGDVYETPGFITCGVIVGEESCRILYNKTNGKVIAYKKTDSKLFQSAPAAQAVYKDEFYKIIPVLETRFMKIEMDNQKFALGRDERDFENYHAISSFSENDNPIVAVYKIKSF